MTAERDEHGRLKKGSVINPSGKGGFQDHPEKRSNGRWDKRTAADYLYNLFCRMTPEEVKQYQEEHGSLTFNERKAINLVIAGAKPVDESPNALKAAQYVDERTQGKPKQQVENTIKNVDPPTFQISIEGQTHDKDMRGNNEDRNEKDQ